MNTGVNTNAEASAIALWDQGPAELKMFNKMELGCVNVLTSSFCDRIASMAGSAYCGSLAGSSNDVGLSACCQINGVWCNKSNITVHTTKT